MKAPLAEHYHSIQGEGVWSGTPMHFIRLAGCTVGKYPIGEENVPLTSRGKPAWRCHTWDNRPFWCDTDFHKYDEVEVQDLIRDTTEHHICLTGGEPLMHEAVVREFCNSWTEHQKTIHIETSGTIWWERPEIGVRLTVSPKRGCTEGMINQADQIKLLVDREFDVMSLPLIPEWQKTFLQPINDINTVNRYNLQLCLRLLEKYPHWRLSPQWHKLLGVR